MTYGCHGCHGCRHKENPYARAQVSLLYHGNCGNHGNCAMTGTLPSLVQRMTAVMLSIRTNRTPYCRPQARLQRLPRGLGQSGIGWDRCGRTLRTV